MYTQTIIMIAIGSWTLGSSIGAISLETSQELVAHRCRIGIGLNYNLTQVPPEVDGSVF